VSKPLSYKLRQFLGRRARINARGPMIRTDVECLACGFEGTAMYQRDPPLMFNCPHCKKRQGVRASSVTSLGSDEEEAGQC